jgi:glutamate 5-kinase
VTVVVPIENVAPGAFVLIKVDREQLSVAVGAVQLTTAWQALFAGTEMLDGHPAMTGLVLSLTMTLKEQVELLPLTSVAVYVTRVVPFGNVVPEVCVLVKVAIAQLSEAVGSDQVTTAWQAPFVVVIMLAGQFVMTGSMLSFTVTVKEQFDVFP